MGFLIAATTTMRIILIVLVYMAPAIIANGVGHREVRTIMVFNILLGWTVFGWIAALLLALLDGR